MKFWWVTGKIQIFVGIVTSKPNHKGFHGATGGYGVIRPGSFTRGPNLPAPLYLNRRNPDLQATQMMKTTRTSTAYLNC